MTSEADDDQLVLIGFDLVKAVRLARDSEAMRLIYRRVFGSTEGRAILFDLMARSHVMDRRPGSMSAMERAQMDGMASFLIELCELAGLDTYERVAGLQAADAVESMERAHERTIPDDRADSGYEPNRSDLEFGGDEDEL